MRRKMRILLPFLVVIIPLSVFFVYTGQYYHADSEALTALEGNDNVRVIQTDYGWFFDGPSDEDALIFYPGGKVEETAYAPLMRHLAQGMDVCLVKMPFRLAVFGENKAAQVQKQYRYSRWYIGGHSLGGVMAAKFAAAHGESLSGVILLAAYPIRPLDEHLKVVSIYGSQDDVLNRAKREEGRKYMPQAQELVLQGGNHAQFGNYGRQEGDGEASISVQEQQEQAASFLLQAIQ
jgi:hypothetical protein